LDNKKIHIVSFDVPFPANYGGVIDIFYRIKALHKLGYEITLHCFEYGRSKDPELEQYTIQTIYYPRKITIWDQLSKLPFIVKSRLDKNLLRNLQKDQYPILFEGIHTTGILSELANSKRKLFVRTHNIEHHYYKQLAINSKGWKKIYFLMESKKLKSFESSLKRASAILTIKESDRIHFSNINPKSYLLPASFDLKRSEFHKTKPYVLYHGNLSVEENIFAVKYLVEEIWMKNKLEIPFIIAGKSPNIDIKNKYAQIPGIKIIESPTQEEMDTLLSEASIHLLTSNQNTGIKLKLLNALQSSGHVIVNQTMIEGTDLSNYCLIANSAEEIIKNIKSKIDCPLQKEEFLERINFLREIFDVTDNCRSVFDKLLIEN
jgi:hypothetical protein